MAAASTALKRQALTLAALAAASIAGFAASSAYCGIAPNWLRNAIRAERGEDRQAAAPVVARYGIDEGGVFIFDRSARRPLLKLEDGAEVWVLYPSRGPRGDVIYKNDMGEPVLRATKLGGMTVFTSRRPGGSAATLLGPSAPLRIAPLGPVGLYERLFQASVRSSRVAQHLVGFDALDANVGSDGLIADAALVAVGAMVSLAARPGGRSALARVGKVAFVEGGKPEVSMRAGVLMITVAPSRGLAGRPSSERIMSALGGPSEAAIPVTRVRGFAGRPPGVRIMRASGHR
ncbi:MAG TPA: DUF4908 domain-containing protein [Caulobacteraceae bacterium]